jgi:rhamnogalacturonan endolyase
MLTDRTFNLNVKEKRGMKEETKPTIAIVLGTMLLFTGSIHAQRYMENLGRGVVAIPTDSSHVYVGWRMLGTDPNNIAFNLYRSTGGGAAVKRNSSPITLSTNYVDSSVNLNLTNSYFVRPVLNGQEGAASRPFTLPAYAPVRQYILIPIQVPADGTDPDGKSYTYSANDCSVGDLDGDGEYEIVLKWDPNNSKDNADPGYTGNVFLDAYKQDGTFMWRIDLGINIRAGAHYTQFMVYDLDSDGKAEVACKTADGTVDGGGNVIGDPNADWRSKTGSTKGKILSGPEYLTIFDGLTGAELVTTNYIPPRGTSSAWGDSTGNRVDRFLACVAYLDGVRPSLVMCRGYYTRTVLAAWDWRNGQLTQRWVFDTGFSGGPWSAWKGQGNHNLSVGDVDGDGKDEIVYGACAIDDDGTGLYTTGLGHGDAMHLSDMDPDRPGLEVWDVHETASSAGGGEFRDANTGQLIWGWSSTGDTGRGLAAHIDSRYRGFQFWSSARGGTYDVNNTEISTTRPSYNFAVWWDADLQRELQDAADGPGKNCKLDKWNGNGVDRLLSMYTYPTLYGCQSINGTKANPCLSGDIWGDWREEMIFRLSDDTGLIVFNTTTQANNRFYTFMHDPQYRLSIAWQNVAYNQPPHTSFYMGIGMAAPPHPDIRVLYGDLTGDNIVDIDDLSEFSKSWLVTDCNDVGLDWNDDCIINFYEFSLLAQNWLKGTP